MESYSTILQLLSDENYTACITNSSGNIIDFSDNEYNLEQGQSLFDFLAISGNKEILSLNEHNSTSKLFQVIKIDNYTKHFKIIVHKEIDNFIVLFKEISNEVHTLKKNNEQLQIFQAILKASIDCIIVISKVGKIIIVNPAVEKLFGYSQQELIGENIKMLMPDHIAEKHDGFLQKYQSTNTSKVIGTKRELQGKKKNGEHFEIELSLSEIANCGDAKFMGIISDISEKKEFEREIIRDKEIFESKNIELKRLNDEILLRNEEIKSQREEIIVQRDLAIEQKREIESQKAEIIDSIMYAQKIQQASLPMQVYIDFIFPKHFLIYEPKDIVSGDFYWVFQKGHYSLFAVADCTGHGVPGSFLTIMGLTFLNDIANNISEPDPAVILNHLRNKVIRALHQTEKKYNVADGMDISLCVINEKTKMLQFAGAYNSAFIVRGQFDENCKIKSEFFELKGDKMPIGSHVQDTAPFTTHSFMLQEKDMIYIFSDGVIHQFGGPKGKKFTATKLKNYLTKIFCLPVPNQQKLLSEEIKKWRTNQNINDQNFQTDDICVMGVRISYEDLDIEKIARIDYDWEL